MHHPARRKPARKPAIAAAPTPAATGSPPPGAAVNAEVGELKNPVTSILGKRVQSPQGEDLGRVVDLLADGEGRVRVAIIDFGGFLGVGTRRIAVDWPLLHFDPANGEQPVRLDVPREKLQSAPEYKDASRPRVLMPAPGALMAAPGEPTSAAAPPAPK